MDDLNGEVLIASPVAVMIACYLSYTIKGEGILIVVSEKLVDVGRMYVARDKQRSDIYKPTADPRVALAGFARPLTLLIEP